MALDPCNPCDCDPGPLMLNEQSARVTVGRMLCSILQAIEQLAGAPNEVLAYNEVTNLGDNTLATVVTFTAIADTVISSIICSGTDYAKFLLVIDTNVKATQRSGPDRNTIFDLNLSLVAGSVLDVKVIHYDSGLTSDFEVCILGK